MGAVRELPVVISRCAVQFVFSGGVWVCERLTELWTWWSICGSRWERVQVSWAVLRMAMTVRMFFGALCFTYGSGHNVFEAVLVVARRKAEVTGAAQPRSFLRADALSWGARCSYDETRDYHRTLGMRDLGTCGWAALGTQLYFVSRALRVTRPINHEPHTGVNEFIQFFFLCVACRWKPLGEEERRGRYIHKKRTFGRAA